MLLKCMLDASPRRAALCYASETFKHDGHDQPRSERHTFDQNIYSGLWKGKQVPRVPAICMSIKSGSLTTCSMNSIYSGATLILLCYPEYYHAL